MSTVAKRLHRALRVATFRLGGLQALCYTHIILVGFLIRVLVVVLVVVHRSRFDHDNEHDFWGFRPNGAREDSPGQRPGDVSPPSFFCRPERARKRAVTSSLLGWFFFHCPFRAQSIFFHSQGVALGYFPAAPLGLKIIPPHQRAEQPMRQKTFRCFYHYSSRLNPLWATGPCSCAVTVSAARAVAISAKTPSTAAP